MDINWEFNLVYILGICFVYSLLKLKIQPMNGLKNYIFYFLMVALFLLESFIYSHFFWTDGYGEIHHSPNYIENTFMLFAFLWMFDADRRKALYYIVLGFISIQFTSLVTSLIRFFYVDIPYKEEFLYLLQLGLLVIIYFIMKKMHKTNKKKLYSGRDWLSFAVLAILFYVYLYYTTEIVPHQDFTDMYIISSFEYIQVIFMILVYLVFGWYLSTLGGRNRSLQELELKLDNQKQQKKLFDELQSANQENRKLRHDLKHHFNYIEGFIDTDPQLVKEYVQKLSTRVETVQAIYNDNTVLNYILNSKGAICKEKDISYTVTVHDSLEQMEDFDLISVISNALDNAIEAQEYVENKYIICNITNANSSSKIQVINACNPAILKKHGDSYRTIKKEHKNHGIGLNRIKSVAESYHGNVEILVSDTTFTLNVSISKNIH